jgi:hypothetical protein
MTLRGTFQSFPPGDSRLSEEIIDLLAEALFKDFQEHRRATVNSPQGIDHTKLLTDVEKTTRDAQVD